MTSSPNLDQMFPGQLRALAEQAIQLLSQVDAMGKKIHRLETSNEQLAHEIAILKRYRFAKRSEQLSPDQGSLLDDLLDTDIVAIEGELAATSLRATAVAVRLPEEGSCEIAAPLGVDDLFGLIIRPAGRFPTEKTTICQDHFKSKTEWGYGHCSRLRQ